MKSVRTALRALELLSDATPEIGVSEVSRHLKIGKSSASRLLAALGDGGLLEQDPATRRYRAGLLALRLGSLRKARSNLHEIVQGAMATLARETGHSCFVSVLAGNEIVVLNQVHGGYPIRFMVEPGRRLPAHATAVGKAMLARLSNEEVRAFYPTPRLVAPTPYSLRSVDALIRHLSVVRDRGWAETDQETFPGIKSIGVAFRSEDARSVIGLSLSRPLSSLGPEGDAPLLAILLRGARWVGRQIGDPLWSKAEPAGAGPPDSEPRHRRLSRQAQRPSPER